MRIAIFSDTYPPKTDGVANTVYHSAKSLSARGHEVAVFTVTKNHNDNLKIENDRFTVFTLPSVPVNFIYPNLRFTLPLGISLKRLKKFGPDVIHTHTPFSVGWEAIITKKIIGAPIVGTHHTFYDHYLKYIKLNFHWAKNFSWKYTIVYYNFCDLVLSPTRSLAVSLKENGLNKPIRVINNMIDTEFFRPAANQTEKKRLKESFGLKGISLVYMGRLGYEKSIDQVINAFILIRKKIPGVKLVIIGDGPERKKLESQAASLGVKNEVIFTGFLYRENLVRRLQANEIFLTACKNENMPLAVLEAMAAGLPVISVREKGLAEIIKPGVNGYFAKTDSPEDLAQNTITLLSQPRQREEFSQASRSLSLEYSYAKVAASLENSYQQILNHK